MDNKTKNLIDQKIDDLALAMHKGFEEVNKRFDGVEGEITSIKQDLKGVKETMATKFQAVDERFEEMERKSQERHNELMDSNDKLIRIFEASQQEFASSKFITDKQEERLENLEKRVGVLELQKAV